MKKLIVFAAIAATLLASCAKTENLQKNTGQGDPVAFGVYAGKAAITKTTFYGNQTTSTLKNDSNDYGFGVFAYYTKTTAMSASEKPNFMYNQQVIYDSSADATKYPTGWYYTPIKYWPNGQNNTTVETGTAMRGKYTFPKMPALAMNVPEVRVRQLAKYVQMVVPAM